jgi:DNA-binding XRE family transcriptional regulator
MTIAIRASSKDTVLLLDPEFERRIEAAARLIGIDPAEFIARAVQHRCADVLGEAGPGSGSAAHASASTGLPAATNDAHGSQAFDQRRNGPWAIRPTPDRVLRTIAEASRLSIETVVGPGRGRAVACARAVAAYLLCNDAGLSQKETARIIHRKSARVVQLTRSVAQVADSTDPQAELLARARRLLRNGISTGKDYPPLPHGTGDANLVPGLLPARLASGLTQPQLAARTGIARETLSRLERLRRRARPETVRALANTLEVSLSSLTTPTAELGVALRSARRADW